MASAIGFEESKAELHQTISFLKREIESNKKAAREREGEGAKRAM